MTYGQATVAGSECDTDDPMKLTVKSMLMTPAVPSLLLGPEKYFYVAEGGAKDEILHVGVPTVSSILPDAVALQDPVPLYTWLQVDG